MYASDNKISYPFKESNPITIRKKNTEWILSGSGRTIESEHPPLRSLTIEHGELPVEIKTSPYKIHKDPESDLDSIIQQNNFYFAKAIRDQLDRIEASSSSSKVQITPDSAQSSKIGVLEYNNVSIASSDIEAFKEEPSVPKANKIHWELALPTVKSPPDLAIDNMPSALNQSRFNASSVYEWNIDGMSEYNILGLLQQMTIAANTYKTQSGASDKAIAEILIVGFTGQLKGWWDHLLTKQQQLDILDSIQIDENGAPILDEFNSPIQDAIATLILTISLYFIGDHSHLRDKNAELLHNLRCRKLSEFQNYKTTFFTILFLRDDANHITWKEKFIAGLPTLLGEKVRNSIKALYDNRIPYDELTYGELVNFINKEGLKICQDLKLQKRLKWELRKSKQELAPLLIESSDFESSMTEDSEPLQIMPPKKKDKGKAVLKDTESHPTSKEPQSTPSKEKLLSSAMPIKSWIEMAEEQEAQYKATTSEDQSKLSEATIQSWLSTRGLLAPSKEVAKAQSTFLAQRAKSQSLLASAKTEDEYFKVMQQLLATRSEPSVASSSSSSSGDAEPFISLGDENEDDCFRIFSSIKH
ncbi:hypothetical protein KPL70_000885 [Citrus sinensis]|nr:hypothetical protein KPL70_000885 [Citrus sinensis]